MGCAGANRFQWTRDTVDTQTLNGAALLPNWKKIVSQLGSKIFPVGQQKGSNFSSPGPRKAGVPRPLRYACERAHTNGHSCHTPGRKQCGVRSETSCRNGNLVVTLHRRNAGEAVGHHLQEAHKQINAYIKSSQIMTVKATMEHKFNVDHHASGYRCFLQAECLCPEYAKSRIALRHRLGVHRRWKCVSLQTGRCGLRFCRLASCGELAGNVAGTLHSTSFTLKYLIIIHIQNVESGGTLHSATFRLSTCNTQMM